MFDEIDIPEMQPGVPVGITVPLSVLFLGVNKETGRLRVAYVEIEGEQQEQAEATIVNIPSGTKMVIENPEGRVPIKIGKLADKSVLYELVILEEDD